MRKMRGMGDRASGRRRCISFSPMPILRVAAMLAALAIAGSCGGGPLGRQYEYEEQIYLRVDGSATVIVNASIAALVALRGVDLDPSNAHRIDRADVRRAFEVAGCEVASVGQPWRRQGRRFVQVRIATEDVRTLATCGILAWSTYALDPIDDDRLRYVQVVGLPAGRDPGPVKWTGKEVVGFKLHAPSRIEYHNVKRLEDGTNGEVERGNILTWEQYLADRRAGRPLDMEVRMSARSILFQTIFLFAGALVAALSVLGILIWLTIRRGRTRARAQAG
jgi:hypothetical protein